MLNNSTPFIPTWLYIKQHNQTGLKYFGKTSKEDPEKYLGSGIYWLKHLAAHGTDISTPWAQLFTDRQSLITFALTFSEENNIVKSREWANMIVENGLDGRPKGIPSTKKGVCISNPRSEQWRILQSESQKGKIRSNVTDTTRHVLSEKSSGQVWWNNGISRTKARDCPGDGWRRGRNLS